MLRANQGADELEQAEVGVGAVFVTGAELFEPVEPYEGAFNDPLVTSQPRPEGRLGRTMRGCYPRPLSGRWYLCDRSRVGEQFGALRRGRPRRPRIGEIASTSGMSCVTSWR